VERALPETPWAEAAEVGARSHGRDLEAAEVGEQKLVTIFLGG
jgi:hypothetical protein